MQSGKTEDILSSIIDILNHIEEVQRDVAQLSERSAICFHGVVEENKINPNKETLDAFQYQDIITQQLDAVSEAISTIRNSITVYLHSIKEDRAALGGSIEKLSAKLIQSLDTAKAKKEAFSGNSINTAHGESIEFF
jgi:hypothetical protein